VRTRRHRSWFDRLTTSGPPPPRAQSLSKGERASGFTLLEVMVALAILAGAMLAVSQMTSGALRNHARAVRLEVATLLARGKLASLQDGFDKNGFRDFDQTDEGSFDEQGHPEVRWKLEVLKPSVELGPDQILAVLTGARNADGEPMDLATLLGGGGKGGDGKSTPLETIFPGAAAAAGTLNMQLAMIGENIKKGLRQIRLTVSWKDGARDESFTVVTHLIAFPGVSP
jgi:general secretion pathway protein I